MNPVFEIQIKDIIPEPDAVLSHQGVTSNTTIDIRISSLLAEALDLFRKIAFPKNRITHLSNSKFEDIFTGEGLNATESPLKTIYPQADRLALYAVTMGNEVSQKIENLFVHNEYALGYMLDSVASLAADNAVEACESHFHQHLSEVQTVPADNYVLAYSPGYCGWHISAQKKLFDYVKPEDIGISLNESFMMTPLKSTTGVLVSGRKDIHMYACNFDFCKECTTFSCQERMQKLLVI